MVKATVLPAIMYGGEIWTIKTLSSIEFMLLKWDVGKDSWESLELEGDQVNSKGNQPWIFIGRTDTEAEYPVLWPPDAKSQPTGKNLILGKMKAGGEVDDKECDGWMASSAQ